MAVYRPCGPELAQGHRISRPRGTGSVGDSVGECGPGLLGHRSLGDRSACDTEVVRVTEHTRGAPMTWDGGGQTRRQADEYAE